MGEGVIEPRYFLKEMRWWEAIAVVDGIQRRYRSGWEHTRWLGWIITATLGGKDYPYESPNELMPFEWEKERHKSSKEDEEQLQRLLQEAREYNKKLIN